MKTKIDRPEAIMIKLSIKEKKQLVELAARYDMTVSDLFRRVMLPTFLQGGVKNGNS